jgi:7-cyano-7-deazaguanine synthase in queuosine biosynthesis
MERVDILWTGGFDSTYRVCQLSLLPVEIQAYYIDADKKSFSQELKAMADIVAYIQANPSTKCSLLPLVIIKLDDIAPDKQIEDSYKRIRSEAVIGSQYEWFARFAKQSGLILELGFETDTNSVFNDYDDAHLTCRKVSRPLSDGEGILEYFEPVRDRSTEDMMNLFGPFRFGSPLYEMTKLQTVESYKAMGYEAVMSMTWFCAHPLKGKPCGMCNPCGTVMKAGMGFRLPFIARVLYYLFKANRTGRYVDGKIKAMYNRNWR